MKVVKSYWLIVSGRTVCFALIALLFAFQWSADAQQEGARIPRIGYLADFGSPDGDSSGKHHLPALRQGLRDLGYIEGKNIRLDYRYPKDNPEQTPELAADLVRLKVDILIAADPTLKARANALVTVSNAVLRPNAKKIADLAIKNRLASICEASQYVVGGCLMSYATDDTDSYRRVAIYVDKILKGAKPGELPIEQPTKFELVVNLKTAKQIGLTIPPNLLARADRVIK